MALFNARFKVKTVDPNPGFEASTKNQNKAVSLT